MCCRLMAAPARPPSPGRCVAMAIAFRRLVEAGTLKKLPLIQMVAATSVGIVEGVTLLDLAYEEDSQAEVDMNVVMTEGGGLVEVQATAERNAFPLGKIIGDDGSCRARDHRTGGRAAGGASTAVTR